MSKKALIIDDDEMTLMSLKNLLKQEGIAFEISENGNDGIEKLKSSSFDLVFIDFNLPDMGGDQVLAKIKEKQKLEQEKLEQTNENKIKYINKR